MPYLDSTQPALPWQSGSDTSHTAAERARIFAGEQGARYFAWLTARGAHGGTDAEAERALSMRRSSICARRNELREAKLVWRSSARRGGCAVWRVA